MVALTCPPDMKVTSDIKKNVTNMIKHTVVVCEQTQPKTWDFGNRIWSFLPSVNIMGTLW